MVSEFQINENDKPQRGSTLTSSRVRKKNGVKNIGLNNGANLPT